MNRERIGLGIAILNWNGEGLLRQYLPSVVAEAERLPSARVFVIDNGSSDGSLALLQEAFASVVVIPLSTNFGFAEGYNKGLALMDERYDIAHYLILNSDVEIPEGGLAPLLSLVESHPSVVAAMPRILALRERGKYEYAGACGGYLDALGFPFCRGRIIDSIEADNPAYNAESHLVHWTSGACMLVRRDSFWSAGAFDASFFAHMEEIDLCWRLRRTGGELMAVPEAMVFHLGGASLSYGSPRKAYLNHRNSLLMLRRNLQGGRKAWVLTLRVALQVAEALHQLLIGQGKLAWAVLCALSGLWRPLSKMPKCNGKAPLAPYSLLWHYYLRKARRFTDLPNPCDHE